MRHMRQHVPSPLPTCSRPPQYATTAASALVLACAGAGCLEPLPDVTRIDALRVLGVQAEPPEVPPGGAVSLSALVVDPTGANFNLAWYVCLVAERGQGFFGGGGVTSTSGGDGAPLDTDPDGSSCRKKVAAGRPWSWSLGTAPTATFTVPENLLEDPEVLATSFGFPPDLPVPEEIRQGLLGIAGLNLTAELVVTSDDPTTPEIVATRRINVSLDSPLPDNARNRNPVGFSLLISDTSSDAPSTDSTRCLRGPAAPLKAGCSYALEPAGFPEAPDPYWVILAGSGTDQPFELQNITETWFYSFFATAGRFDKESSKAPGSPDNVWRLDASARGPQTLWFVVRDGRGGIAWCEETFTVE